MKPCPGKSWNRYSSGGNTKRQVVIMKDFGSTILTATPSYTLHLAEAAEETGVAFNSLNFKFGILGAEPGSEKMRKEIERKLNLIAVDICGLSEVMGPGVAIECHEAKKGLHVFEDHFIPEIVDPQTIEPLPYGATGELVFTSPTKEAFPVIRYRARDSTALNPDPCICGRTHLRMNRVTGRSDDMLIIRGVNVRKKSGQGRKGCGQPQYLIFFKKYESIAQVSLSDGRRYRGIMYAG
jgi:phenylacetate-CoA ligase